MISSLGMATTSSRSRLVGVALAGLVLLAIWLSWPSRASAERPVIPPGREAEIIALFEPYAFGDELAPGYVLHSMNIDRATVIIWIAGPQDTYARVQLDHPDYGSRGAEPLPSFAWSVAEAPPSAEAALAKLRGAIVNNDDGRFWAAAPIADGAVVEDVRTRAAMAWMRDALLLGLLLLSLLAVLIRDALREVPTWQRWALLGIVVVGAVLRVTVPVHVGMDPWPYTRVFEVAQLVYASPSLAMLHGEPLYLSDAVIWTTLALSILGPLAMYPHARSVLLDPRAALAVAGIVAVLPMHLRFSASDTGFIPTLTLASVAFAATYAGLHEPRRARAALMLGFVAVLMAVLFLLRPLNAMYVPLLLGLPFVAQGIHEDRPRPSLLRIGSFAALLIGVTLAVGVPHLLGEHSDDVREGLGVDTLRSALGVLVSGSHNTLFNPRFTPPGLSLLALLGVYELARRRRLRLLVYLSCWLLGFLVAHSYVVPREPVMQTRYHLHLVTPFLLLAAAGLDAVWGWLARLGDARRLAAVGLLALYLAASPLLHLRYVRDVEFNELREWLFVHELREQIEPGCVVLEHTGMGTDSRMERVGAYIEAGVPRQRFTHISLARDDEGRELSDEALAALTDPPECLYLLQALPCFSAKPDELPIAPVCHAALGWQIAEHVTRLGFESRVYDENLGAHLGDVEWIELTLFRLYPRPK